jgi:hypothetical protein
MAILSQRNYLDIRDRLVKTNRAWSVYLSSHVRVLRIAIKKALAADACQGFGWLKLVDSLTSADSKLGTARPRFADRQLDSALIFRHGLFLQHLAR